MPGVPTHVALLRGVNVNGHRRVPMADLRRLTERLGHADVATYVQSGNVVPTAQEPEPVVVAAGLERAILERLGHEVAVVVLTRQELA